MLIRILVAFLALIVVAVIVVAVQLFRNSGQTNLTPPAQGTLRVASYNVHYIITFRETGPWSVGDWERRREPLDLAFKAIQADVIGFQEMESFAGRSNSSANLTLDWLLDHNPGYSAAAAGDPASFPSTQPLLYRTDRLRAHDQGWFFFSETPDVIYSRTFNGSFPAFASWALFEDLETRARFRVVNLHTDFRSRTNRQRSAALVAERIAPWIEAGETLFVIGDFNARQGARTLDIIEQTGIHFPPVQGATYHLNRGLNLFGAIDHIGLAGDAQPSGAPVVVRQQFGGEWPTDHYPVLLDVALGRLDES